MLSQSGILGFPNRVNNLTANREYRLTSAGSEYLSLPHASDVNFDRTSSFTICLLVKFSSSMSASFVPLYSKRPSSGAGIQLFKSDVNNIYWVMVGSSQSATYRGSFTIPMEQWVMISVVYSGTPATVKMYLNDKDDSNTAVGTPNLTSQTVANTQAILVNSRLNTPIYGDTQVGGISIFDRALGVNEIPYLWNNGVPRFGSTVANCVRDYRFNLDTFSSNYILVNAVSGNNGTSVNLSGNELVTMNSVTVPTPLNPQATPQSSTEIFVGWDPAGPNVNYDVDVSNDGSTGWVRVASALDTLYYVHTGLANSTTRYYRVRANGPGTVSSNSSTVNATTLSSSYTDVLVFNTRRLGDNSYNFALSVETQRVAPQQYYSSVANKTFCVFMSRAEQGYSMVSYVYYYDHALGTFSEPKYVGVKSRQGLDRHPIPAIMVANSGHIIVAHTDYHNEPMQIWRSNTPYNIDAFTRIGEVGTGDRLDYPEFRKLSNGNIVMFFRHYPNDYSTAAIGYSVSTDNGATWGTIVDIMKYTSSIGRPYPALLPQTEASDRIHIVGAIRNDTGGPFPADPDKVGYFKDYGYIYSDDLLTWRSVNNAFSKQVVSSGFITAVEWQSGANIMFLDSAGTVDCGLAVGIITAAGDPLIITLSDAGTYRASYWNGSAWVPQTITWSDGQTPDIWSFGYHGAHRVEHVSGNEYNIWVTKSGVVKKYNTTNKFVTTTLVDGAVLPNINSKVYEHGSTTHNIYQATQAFMVFGLKTTPPTPTDLSPGAWSDIVMKKLW